MKKGNRGFKSIRQTCKQAFPPIDDKNGTTTILFAPTEVQPKAEIQLDDRSNVTKWFRFRLWKKKNNNDNTTRVDETTLSEKEEVLPKERAKLHLLMSSPKEDASFIQTKKLCLWHL